MMSIPQEGGIQGLKLTCRIVARDPCPTHRYTHWDGKNVLGETDLNGGCRGGFIGESFGNCSCKAYAQLIQANLHATAETIADVGNSARSISANSASTAVYVVAGTTAANPAAFTDYALGDGVTHTDYKSTGNYANTGTVNAISGTAYTITSTITNGSGSSITYKECGLATTVATWQFLHAHDQVNGTTGYTVSASGTLQVTYTSTFT